MPVKATQNKNGPSARVGVTIAVPLADQPPDNSVYIPRHVEVGHLSGEHGRMLYRLREGFRAAGTVLASGKPVYQNADVIRCILDLFVSAAATRLGEQRSTSNGSNHAQKEDRKIIPQTIPAETE